MTKGTSIAYISGLMSHPDTISDADKSSIANLRQTYPYFVPARYLEVAAKLKGQPLDELTLTTILPYLGNRIQFHDFLQRAKGMTADEIMRSVAKPAASADIRPDEEVTNVSETGEIVTAEAHTQEDTTEPVTEEQVVEEMVISDETEDSIAENSITTTEEATEAITQQEPEATPEPVESFWIQDEFEEEITEAGEVNEPDAVIEQPKETETTADSFDMLAGAEPETTDSETVTGGDIPHISELLKDISEHEEAPAPAANTRREKPLISPVYTDDYFLQQGMKISTEIPDELDSLKGNEFADSPEKSLMVMMSFTEWLLHFKHSSEKQKEENRDQKALKTMWQKEKLAAAIEEENEEIPENVFEMAVNSIAKEDGLASEALAEIYVKQGKLDKAIDMYRKLSLRNPQKNTYFAAKIEEISKNIES